MYLQTLSAKYLRLSIPALRNNRCSYFNELIDSQAETEPHDVIHEVRKSLKNIRRMLRLVRKWITSEPTLSERQAQGFENSYLNGSG